MKLAPRQERETWLEGHIRVDAAYPYRADAAAEKTEISLAKSGHVYGVPGKLKDYSATRRGLAPRAFPAH